jgi:hypothetical protein
VVGIRVISPVAAALGTLAAASALVLGGCLVDEKDEPPPPVETSDPLPKLPRDWSREVSRDVGFAIGVPPRWTASERRRSSLFRSPDRLVPVSVSADRTAEGLAVPLDEYATRVADSLRGFRNLKAGKPRPFRAHYDAVAVPATGDANGGVPQRLLVVVERRDGLVTYTLLVARNAKVGAGAHGDEVRRMVRSLRGRQPSGRSG